MKAADVLADLSQRGVTFTPIPPDRLRVAAPPGVLSEGDRELLRELKSAILAELRGAAPAENANVEEYERNERNEISPTAPPDDPLSNEVRARLLLWGGPLGWPSLVEVGLGAGGEAWTAWLMAASLEDLKQAILAAVRAEHTTLALDVEALRLWPGAGILREEQWKGS